MSDSVTLAISQMTCSWDRDENISFADSLIRDASSSGADILLLQELFEYPYFCASQNADYFDLARPLHDNPLISHFCSRAREHKLALPLSFFESTERQFFNSVAMIDSSGEVLGVYRKTHIPDGPGYQEKFYFTPGDTGFCVWDLGFARVGVGICWDQWFPECARSMALRGADILLYPTAIGSEPHSPTLDSKRHWQRTMQGHAAANMCILGASNRVGVEDVGDGLTFYGGSFVADETGDLLVEMDDSPGLALSEFDLSMVRRSRRSWGLFRDRRPDMYDAVLG